MRKIMKSKEPGDFLHQIALVRLKSFLNDNSKILTVVFFLESNRKKKKKSLSKVWRLMKNHPQINLDMKWALIAPLFA